MDNMIDITGTDLRELMKKVYDMSEPVGLGMRHYRPGPLDDEMLDKILTKIGKPTDEDVLIHMDYVHGRCCKFCVWHKDGKLLINNRWPDHSLGQLVILHDIIHCVPKKLGV